MQRIAADLHIHTVLSPCAARDMTPRAIVRAAVARGLEMIAVCDHNTAGNAAAVAEAAARTPGGPTVICGIEITTVEEVHVLGWFPGAAEAEAAGDEVLSGLPPWRPFAPRTSPAGNRLPDQQVMDADDRCIAIEGRMLAAASRFDLGAVVDLIHRHGGIAVAAHMDRRSFSVPGQLGFLPPDVPFDGLEISSAGVSAGEHERFACHGLPLVSSSDSHFLQEIATGLTALLLERPCFDELALALRGAEGRGCAIA
ncbi:MAG TPA: PHP domain-containing protein [Spirochaetia bacterium]